MGKQPEQLGMNSGTWASHRITAWCIRIVIFLLPIAAGLLASWQAATRLPEPTTVVSVIGWWVAVIVTAILAAYATDRLLTRLTPITMLLGLTLAFPDKAPSRFAVMLRSFTVRGVKRAVRSGDLDDSPEQKSASEQLLDLLARLTVHDPQTRGHAERVRAYADLVSEEMGLRQADRDRLRWGALLHDIGKLSVPRSVLNKTEDLDDTDWLVIRNHPLRGESMTESLAEWMGDWRLTISQHHERWDGTGYPFGLNERGISLGARIVSVCDAFDAMTSNRTYGQRFDAEAARVEIAKMSGLQFDPLVVRALMRVSLGRLRAPIGIWAWLPAMPFAGGMDRVTRHASVVAAAALVMIGFSATGAETIPIEVAGLSIEAPEATDIMEPVTAQAPSLSPVPSAAAPATPTPTEQAPPPVAIRAAATVDPAEPTPSTTTPPPPPSTTTTSAPTTTTTLAPTTTTTVAPTTTTTTVPATTTTVIVPSAPNLSIALDEDVTIEFALDAVGDVGLTSGPGLGTVELDTSGRGRYIPDPDANGSDQFSYEACQGGACESGTVSIEIIPVNDDPVAIADQSTTDASAQVLIDVLGNDVDVDGDQLTVATVDSPAWGSTTTDGSSVTFDPLGNSGGVSFAYQACDASGACATATVTVTVTPPPTAGAVDDDITLDGRGASSIDVLSNDDLGPGPYVVSIVSEPGDGTVHVLGNETIQYKAKGFVGLTSFVYEVCDANGGCSRGVVTLTIE